MLIGVATSLLAIGSCTAPSAPIVLLYGASPLAIKTSSGWAGVAQEVQPPGGEFRRVDMTAISPRSEQLLPSKQPVTGSWVFATRSGDAFDGVWVSGKAVSATRVRKELAAGDKRISYECRRALGSLYPYAKSKQNLVASLSGEIGPLQQAWEIDLDGKGPRELVLIANSRNDLGIEAHHKGDYSLAMIKSGSSRTVLVRHQYKEEPKSLDDFGWSTRIEAIADFDGNGTYEIVVVQSNFAGEKVTLFTYVNRRIKSVAETQEGG